MLSTAETAELTQAYTRDANGLANAPCLLQGRVQGVAS
jgi:hypothetical protein